MNLLGIDYGTKRVGIAIGDTESRVAVPYDVLEFGSSTLASISEIVQRESIEAIVVGVPKTLHGEEGRSCELVRQFVKELKSLGVKIILEDERLTTVEVERAMKTYGKAKRGIQKDSAAAAIILQSHLDKL